MASISYLDSPQATEELYEKLCNLLETGSKINSPILLDLKNSQFLRLWMETTFYCVLRQVQEDINRLPNNYR